MKFHTLLILLISLPCVFVFYYFGCLMFSCFLTTTTIYTFYLSFFILYIGALIAHLLINKKIVRVKKEKSQIIFKIFAILVVALSFAFSFALSTSQVNTSHEIWVRQHKDTVTDGTITSTDNGLMYTNNRYRFQVDFPKDWGYEEQVQATTTGNTYVQFYIRPPGKENYDAETELRVTAQTNYLPGDRMGTETTFKGVYAIRDGEDDDMFRAIHFVKDNIAYSLSVNSKNRQLSKHYLPILEQQFNFIK